MAQPKRDAQNALFAAIQNQAENNMRSALKTTEKATLLRELAEAYRLTAGGALPEVPARRRESGGEGGADTEKAGRPSRQRQSRDDSSEEEQEQSPDEEEEQQEERPRRRASRRRAG